MSLRDQILGANDRKVAPLHVPEWGCTVHVRTLSGAERDRLEGWMAPDKNGRRDTANFRGRFAVLVLGDEKGERIFQDTDASALGGKSAAALDRIVEAGLKHNAVSAADVEELAGNSGAAPSGDSVSV